MGAGESGGSGVYKAAGNIVHLILHTRASPWLRSTSFLAGKPVAMLLNWLQLALGIVRGDKAALELKQCNHTL